MHPWQNEEGNYVSTPGIPLNSSFSGNDVPVKVNVLEVGGYLWQPVKTKPRVGEGAGEGTGRGQKASGTFSRRRGQQTTSTWCQC